MPLQLKNITLFNSISNKPVNLQTLNPRKQQLGPPHPSEVNLPRRANRKRRYPPKSQHQRPRQFISYSQKDKKNPQRNKSYLQIGNKLLQFRRQLFLQSKDNKKQLLCSCDEQIPGWAIDPIVAFPVEFTISCDRFLYQNVLSENYISYRMDYKLIADSRQIPSIISMRSMVAAALLFTFTIHYFFVGMGYLLQRKLKVQRMYDHGRRLVLFGIAALLSINFLNYSVYYTIMAWLTLIWVLVMHCMALIDQINQNQQNIALTIYYLIIGIWMLGIVFFYIYNALN